MKSACFLLAALLEFTGSIASAQTGGPPRQLSRPPAAELPVSPAPVSAARYQIGLKSGTVRSATQVTARHPLFKPAFLLLDGQQLAMTDVHFYEDPTGYYLRARLPGAFRETTLHRELAGRLSLFAPGFARYNPARFGLLGIAPVKADYFTKDAGPVQFLRYQTLRRATADSPGAQLLAARAHRYQLANTAGLALGAGMLLTGLVRVIAHLGNADLNGRLTLGLLAGSLPVLAVPLVLKDQPAEHQRQAIELYNAGR